MPHPLPFYISGSPAVTQLADTYGNQLQNMSLDEKLLAIKAISGALLDSLIHRDCEPSIEEQVIHHIDDGNPVDDVLQESLTALDGCDETQCFALLTALVAYGSEEFRSFGSVDSLGSFQEDWEPDFS